MEEIRIDCANQSPEELALAKKQAQLVFRLNHTMPMTEEYDNLVREIFGSSVKCVDACREGHIVSR